MDSDEELKPLIVMLSSHKLRKLEELADLRDTTMSELAHNIIQLWLLKEYPPRTPEEYERETRDGWKDLRRKWAGLFWILWRRLLHSIKRMVWQDKKQR
jgi:hypothetical protein